MSRSIFIGEALLSGFWLYYSTAVRQLSVMFSAGKIGS